MLMPRLEYNNSHSNSNSSVHTTDIVHPIKKIRLLGANASSSMRQQTHIKQLITTAATGTGIVGDVDAQLTPIQAQGRSSSSPPKQRNDGRPERNLWNVSEMLEMLKVMQEMNALEKLSDKMIKSDVVFREVEQIMHANGFRKKSYIQIWTKWKFLKSTYNTTKRSGTVPKMIPSEVYQKLCKMLENGSSNAATSSECGNSWHSMDSDENSNIANGDDELSVTREKTPQKEDNSETTQNDLSIAHPIFGFHLGLVKSEPADNGYETLENNNTMLDHDALSKNQGSTSNTSFDHIPFSIKKELEEDTCNTPPPTAPASPTLMAHLSKKSQSNFMPRDTVTPLMTSTPIIAPLRVANFAKEPATSATSSVLKIERPPPPAVPPIPLKRARLNTTNDITFTQPSTAKLMLPKLQNQNRNQPYSYMRLPKDISVQPARNLAGSMRLKQVPMRKTPYSLRPDRMIPDLDQSISPPPSPGSNDLTFQNTGLQQQQQQQQPQYDNYDGIATTSRQAQLSLLKDRKRRLLTEMQPMHSKMSRNAFPADVKSHASILEDEPVNEMDTEAVDRAAAEAENIQQKRDEEFEKALCSLTDSLRQTQHDMLVEFFDQQKEFARREHEFQLKQDTLILRAFRSQTEQLLEMIKSNINIDLNSVLTPEQPKTTTAKKRKAAAQLTEKVEQANNKKNNTNDVSETFEETKQLDVSKIKKNFNGKIDQNLKQIEDETGDEASIEKTSTDSLRY